MKTPSLPVGSRCLALAMVASGLLTARAYVPVVDETLFIAAEGDWENDGVWSNGVPNIPWPGGSTRATNVPRSGVSCSPSFSPVP